MCVIIVRDPGITVPFTKLESAAIVNPDGWGLAVADRGKLSYFHSMKNDPAAIAKALEDAKDQTVLLHLRFTTKGEKVIENCHPFKVMTEGLDIAFAHNGTLYKFGPEKDEIFSDSYKFNAEFLQPLITRFAAFTGPDKVLEDKFLPTILEEAAGSNSKFALLDGNGNSLIINHKDGKEFEGWWASNEYSFQRNHRTSTTTTYHGQYSGFGSYMGDAYNDDEWQAYAKAADSQEVWEATEVKKIEKPKVVELEVMPEQYEPTEEEEEAFADLKEQCQMIGSVVDGVKNPRLNKKLIDHLLQRKVPRFTDLAAIDSLVELTKLDPEDINELVTYYPEASARLIQDLLFELYLKDTVTARTIAAQADKKVA